MKNLTNFKSIILSALIAAFLVTAPLQAQTNLVTPNVRKTGSSTAIAWSAGTVNSGGHAIAIAAGTSTITTSKTDCSSPLFAGCNFVYSNSAGTVAVTTTLATAAASGNVLMAFIETDGTTTTRVVYPPQNWAVLTQGAISPAPTTCGTTTTCANTSELGTLRVVHGSVALTSASPSQAVVTGISPAFTSTSTYTCTASPEGTTAAVAATGIAVSKTSSSSITLTGPNTVTTVVDYTCFGI